MLRVMFLIFWTLNLLDCVSLHPGLHPGKNFASALEHHQRAMLSEKALREVIVHNEEVETLLEGSEVLIEGIIEGQFDIDLRCSPGSVCRPLHISVRPEEQVFVFNAMFSSGIYDLEERRYFFLEKDSFFRISIIIHPSHFQIVINDFWTKSFDHRLDFELVKSIKMKGLVQVSSVTVIKPESR